MEFGNRPAWLRRFDTALGKGSVAVVGLAALLLLGHTVGQVVRLWNPVPCGDIVSQLLWMSQGPTHFTDLFRPNNEHVIAFPRLFYFIDIYGFAASGKFLVAMNVALAVATILFFGYVFHRHLALGWGEAALYLSIVAVLYLNGAHFFNLLYGFMIQHWLENFFLVLFAYAFARLATATRAGAKRKLAVCLLPLASAATFTSGDGILCLAAAVLLGALLRVGWKYVAYFAGALAGLVWLYVKINPAVHGGKPVVLFASVWNSIKFFCAFFGAPFMRSHVWPGDVQFWSFEPAVAVLAGALVVAAGVLLCLRAWLDAEHRDALAVFLVFLFVFLLGTGVLCANSRLELGVYEGTNKKYACTVVLAWVAVFTLLVKQVAEKFALSKRQRQAGLVGSFVVFLAAVLPAHLREKKIWEGWYDHLRESEASLVSGVYGGSVLYMCDWRPREFFDMAQRYLRPRQWAVFGRYPFEMGDALPERFRVAGDYPCTGSFDALLPQEGAVDGFQVAGWAWDTKRQRPVQDVLLVNAAGRIVGLAHSTRDRPDVRQRLPHNPKARCGWFGFAKAAPGDGPLTAYAVIDRRGTVCRLGAQNPPGPGRTLAARR